MTERPTLSKQLAQQHELLMAAVTKTPMRGKRWEVATKQAQVGDLKGRWVCDGLIVAPEEDEDWPQFLGRWQSMLEDIDRELIRRNADVIAAQLKETLERKPATDLGEQQRRTIAAAKARK